MFPLQLSELKTDGMFILRKSDRPELDLRIGECADTGEGLYRKKSENKPREETSRQSSKDNWSLPMLRGRSHCNERRYMFSVKKCKSEGCAICRPPRLPPHIFQTLRHLPDPQPRGSDLRKIYAPEIFYSLSFLEMT